MNTNFSPTIRQLRAFLAVYQLKKLSAAAQRLFVTQSAVSMLIRQLEEGLDTRLFDRTTRSLKATAAAEQMMMTVERILRDVDSLSNDFRELATLERGRVTLAITPTLAAFLLPDAMRAFNEQHPGVRVLVNDCAPDQFVSRIIGEHVDFGIGTPERPGPEVEVQRLMRDHLAVVCRDDHPLAKARVVRWSDLGGHPVITVRPGYGVRPLIDGTAAEAGVALDVVNEVSFLSTAIWMTAAGMGASIMPSAFARAEADPSLVIKVLSSPRVARDISIVTKRGHSLSAAARAFIDALKRSL
ncbi:LysR family transcriptional regulator [Variovorax sp. NFACC27]|jgi:DNA-binding transcriptional LysR family regulator|uniref:LysR family transcriptional regulator n=1 Tax=Variovorax gossypii TaxID=1679495 RepID=A0A431TDT8_9BURK|nr:MULTISPECIES: LysR family transcriptional regulator [Variovorax]MDP9603771.1 DNA-binding transcriptional LysR family regulator [Variovorax paradoxus]SEF26103.1 DNA-binding transcriptional regulator, LysR family [Variovorax sp. NFACC28]SEG52440.1 DNA-binding transcriptional regulator, LysR family [Variovorax sp. NFACC29]SFC17583.1 DNA-binding transcriptional regulator, LysR family [Variovorax sp. NFACC26]SFH00239.1 DNA-binding transcriptional regulator, LysR family [Variovorax sp. NFACC27]